MSFQSECGDARSVGEMPDCLYRRNLIRRLKSRHNPIPHCQQLDSSPVGSLHVSPKFNGSARRKSLACVGCTPETRQISLTSQLAHHYVRRHNATKVGCRVPHIFLQPMSSLKLVVGCNRNCQMQSCITMSKQVDNRMVSNPSK